MENGVAVLITMFWHLLSLPTVRLLPDTNPTQFFHMPNQEQPFTVSDLFSSSTQWFILTNRCQINCHYCFNYLTHDNEDMSPEMAVNILKFYLDHQTKIGVQHDYIRILFMGGEPTLNYPALFAIMDYLNENQIKCLPKLLTNGIIKENILEQLIAKKIYFQISFDGFKNNLRFTKSGADVNPQIIKTLKKVRAANQALQIRATIHAGNVDTMDKIIKFALENDIKEVAFCPVFIEGNAQQYAVMRPTVDAYTKNYFKALELARKHQIIINTAETTPRKVDYNKIDFPLVWMPDGQLASTIQYASSKLEEAKKVLIGKFLMAENTVEINENKIQQMGKQFHQNREKI